MSFKVTLSKPRIHTRSLSLTTKTIIKSINISPGALSKKGKSLKPSTTSRRLTLSQRTTSTVFTSKAVATSSSESLMRLTIASKLLKVIRQLMRYSGLRFQFCFTISKSTRTPSTPSSRLQLWSPTFMKFGSTWAFCTKNVTNQMRQTSPFRKCLSFNLVMLRLSIASCTLLSNNRTLVSSSSPIKSL